MLLVDGGKNDLLTVYNALQKDQPIPIEIARGTGGLADLLCYGYDHANEIFQANQTSVEHNGLMECISAEFTNANTTEKSIIYCQIFMCLKDKERVSFPQIVFLSSIIYGGMF